MVEVLVDGSFELWNGGEDAASDAFLGDQTEEALDLIEPGGRGGGEVQVKARVLGQPCLNVGMLVSSVVVEDEVEITCASSDASVITPSCQPVSSAMRETLSASASAASGH
jgi:hypothetical protein